MTDELLSEVPDQEAVDDLLSGAPVVSEEAVESAAQDFDFQEFVDGIRPGRRQVKIYMRVDLAAELDAILHRAEELPTDMDTEDRKKAESALLEEFQDVKAQIEASARKFVVEARSQHRMQQIIKKVEKLGHPRPGKKATDEQIQAWNNEVALHRLADAIVVPSNVTVEGLRMLDEVAESEIQKLYGAFHDANTNPTKAVTPNFSLGR